MVAPLDVAISESVASVWVKLGSEAIVIVSVTASPSGSSGVSTANSIPERRSRIRSFLGLTRVGTLGG